MRQDGDRASDRALRLTVPEAASVMGISAEAVRSRIKRGTLATERDADGTVFVLVDADRVRRDGDGAGDLAGAQAVLLARMEDEIAFLRGELERKDHLLAAALERIPALEPPQEPRGGPEPATDGAQGADLRPASVGDQEGAERSWLYRFFFGP